MGQIIFVMTTLDVYEFDLLVSIPQEDKQTMERKWAKKIYKIYRVQLYLERHKHMEPFFSEYFTDLALLLQQIYGVKILILISKAHWYYFTWLCFREQLYNRE
jgi:hypothetical protein